MKIVINSCYGGFGLSDKAMEMIVEKDPSLKNSSHYDIPRDHPALIEAIEILGEKANGKRAKLKIVSIPFQMEWIIDEYAGIENVAEKHRTWG